MANLGDLSGVLKGLSRLSSQIDAMDGKVTQVSSQVADARSDLAKLQADFRKMMLEQQRAEALNQAMHELNQVNQQRQRKFGNYNTVRSSMVGILQATDAALVRKATISTVSEELMITTPNYWLAPVLVALAAWINNDRDLAERAIREAVKRDNEHTSLAMALICRRNHRTATCYEWLARYFSTQNAARIDADSMVYIDAYINGVFGPDEKHLCDDYMAQWLAQIKAETPDFENHEASLWANYFQRNQIIGGSSYPALKAVAKEYDTIDKYLGKLQTIAGFEKIYDGIRQAEVDHETLAAQVDEHLMALVQSDDPGERALRERADYLEAIKDCGGDVAAARMQVNEHREQVKRQTMNIVEQMTSAAQDLSGKTQPYRQKSAVQLLRPYINEGFRQYKRTNNLEFPQAVTLSLNGWTGQASAGTPDEAQALARQYATYLTNERDAKIQGLGTGKALRTVALTCLAVGVALALAGALANLLSPVWGVLLAVLGAALFVFDLTTKQRRTKQTADIQQEYATKVEQGQAEIFMAVQQWWMARDAASRSAYLLQQLGDIL